jgi:hypothetical protein
MKSYLIKNEKGILKTECQIGLKLFIILKRAQTANRPSSSQQKQNGEQNHVHTEL